MSVFKVQLNTIAQGQLDINPLTGVQFDPSIQRTMYCPGPNGIWRKLADGAQFTDCNYWMRFAYPNVPLEQAFIAVVTDDGIPYSTIGNEPSSKAVAFQITTSGTASHNFLTTDGGYADSLTITCNQAGVITLNGGSTSITLYTGEVISFPSGEANVTSIAVSGTGGSMSVVGTVKVDCKS